MVWRLFFYLPLLSPNILFEDILSLPFSLQRLTICIILFLKFLASKETDTSILYLVVDVVVAKFLLKPSFPVQHFMAQSTDQE